MIFKIKEIEDNKVEIMYKKAMDELDSFFELEWKRNKPSVIIVKNRNHINKLKGQKTPPWVVGWCEGTNVYLLGRKKYESESNHKYSNEEYFKLIKHELVHCFLNAITDQTRYPVWLFEGVAIYLSEQNKTSPKKLEKFIEYYYERGEKLYLESGFAVKYLVKKFGKGKIIQLLKEVKNVRSKKEFEKLFKKTYGFDLKYGNFKILSN